MNRPPEIDSLDASQDVLDYIDYLEVEKAKMDNSFTLGEKQGAYQEAIAAVERFYGGIIADERQQRKQQDGLVGQLRTEIQRLRVKP